MRARILAPENRKWLTLVAVSFGLFMMMLDNTVVNVALPAIQRDLRIDVSELEWVVNGYALTFAVLMLTGGKLADMLGRRRIFIVGLAIFTGASLACGLATSANWLIGARIVQGVGAAFIFPTAYALVTNATNERDRPRAAVLLVAEIVTLWFEGRRLRAAAAPAATEPTAASEAAEQAEPTEPPGR